MPSFAKKVEIFAVGFSSGALVGSLASVLHSGGVTKRTAPGALFLGSILGIGALIKAH